MAYLNKAYDIKMKKDRVRKCLSCSQEFKCDKASYICGKCKREGARDAMRKGSRVSKMIEMWDDGYGPE